MMRIQTTLSAVLGLATLVAVAPASGQNLSERINTVLEQRATKQATAKGPILRALLTTSISVKFRALLGSVIVGDNLSQVIPVIALLWLHVEVLPECT